MPDERDPFAGTSVAILEADNLEVLCGHQRVEIPWRVVAGNHQLPVAEAGVGGLPVLVPQAKQAATLFLAALRVGISMDDFQTGGDFRR